MRQILPLCGVTALVLLLACGRGVDPQLTPGGNAASDDGGEPDGGTKDAGASADGGEPADGCTGLELGPGDYGWSLVKDGVTRTYLVRVPPGYQQATRTPLVLNFHGYTSTREQQELLSVMTPLAHQAGFIVVYPNGVNAQELGKVYWENNRSWNAGPSCCGVAQYYAVDDVGFVRAMLDDLSERLCIDQRRIFSTGLSNGGFLSHRLACELSDRIAAVAPVAGVNAMVGCAPLRPVPVLQIHGTEDTLVPYGGNANFPAAPATVAAWASRNGCSTTLAESFRNGDTDCQSYQGCAVNAEATLCTVTGGGHTWPGGKVPASMGATSIDYDASAQMWRFFADHPMPQ